MRHLYGSFGIKGLMYLVCSRCHIPIDLAVWSTNELLQILHVSLCILFEFILFCGTLSHSWLYMVLVA